MKILLTMALVLSLSVVADANYRSKVRSSDGSKAVVRSSSGGGPVSAVARWTPVGIAYRAVTYRGGNSVAYQSVRVRHRHRTSGNWGYSTYRTVPRATVTTQTTVTSGPTGATPAPPPAADCP